MNGDDLLTILGIDRDSLWNKIITDIREARAANASSEQKVIAIAVFRTLEAAAGQNKDDE